MAYNNRNTLLRMIRVQDIVLEQKETRCLAVVCLREHDPRYLPDLLLHFQPLACLSRQTGAEAGQAAAGRRSSAVILWFLIRSASP